jgi:hypothetical protein
MEFRHKAEHARLRAMIDDYLALLLPDRSPDIEEIMRRRLAFATAYRGHVAAEGLIFAQLRTGDFDNPLDRLLDEQACRLRAMQPGYTALIRDWTPARIAREWPAYCRQVRDQVARYHTFIAWEEARILPHLSRPALRSAAGRGA